MRSLRLGTIFPRCPPVRDLYWNSLWIPVDFSASGHPNSGILFSRIRIPCYTGSVLSDPLPICTYRNSLPYQYPTGTCIRIHETCRHASTAGYYRLDMLACLRPASDCVCSCMAAVRPRRSNGEPRQPTSRMGQWVPTALIACCCCLLPLEACCGPNNHCSWTSRSHHLLAGLSDSLGLLFPTWELAASRYAQNPVRGRANIF